MANEPVPPIERDRHSRRGPEEYFRAFYNLLPVGQALPRYESEVQSKTVEGMSVIWGNYVDQRIGDLLLVETDPRSTTEMILDWERAFGLPDPCLDEPQTLVERQIVLAQRITMLGGQSRQFFIDLAAGIGYGIHITEYAPWMTGVSWVGATQHLYNGRYHRWEIGTPEIRFFWTVHVDVVKLTWFRVGPGGGQTGIDPHLRIGRATDLECIIRRWKPSHTEVVFDYSGASIPTYLDLSRWEINSIMVPLFM